MALSRRSLFISAGAAGLTLYAWQGGTTVALATLPGGTLPPDDIPKFVEPLLVPPTMPADRRISTPEGPIDSYRIAVRQFSQQVLPAPLPATTVWGYGPVGNGRGRGLFHAPSLTIEAQHGVGVQVEWRNELVDAEGHYLPHLLPVDPTLHWANPGQLPDHDGLERTDTMPDFTGRTYVHPDDFTDPETQYTLYQGPVPIVIHVHGAAGVGDESDGYPEAWYLPDATNLPEGYAAHGTWYPFFAGKARAAYGASWTPGVQISRYPNLNRASTLWFHDHALGMTRQNVYAGPAGFFLVRGGPEGDDAVRDGRTGRRAVLPGPEPAGLRGANPVREIPLAIQDRSFNTDGSLFYPDSRAFFDGVEGPYVPETPMAPAWNPEFFGNTLIVNGHTWPYLEVEQRRYRFRVLNGCNSRFLVLDFSGIPGVRVHQIGNDGGFLPAVHDVMDADSGLLLLGTAERADLVVDFTDVELGKHELRNVGPDEPYGGGVPGVDYEPADSDSTGLVLQFRVVPRVGADRTTPGGDLLLPAAGDLPVTDRVRQLALIEHEHDVDGAGGAPTAALLGVLQGHDGDVEEHALTWMDPVTENPAVGDTEEWAVYNFTADAHTVHVHEVLFEVAGRQEFTLIDGELAHGAAHDVHPGERGRKDTVVAYPGQVTRLRATFATPGQFVWHCHLLEHEDNEMMRPYRIGPLQHGQPDDGGHGHHA